MFRQLQLYVLVSFADSKSKTASVHETTLQIPSSLGGEFFH